MTQHPCERAGELLRKAESLVTEWIEGTTNEELPSPRYERFERIASRIEMVTQDLKEMA